MEKTTSVSVATAVAVHRDELNIPKELDGLSAVEARRRLVLVGPNRWVSRDRLAGVRAFIRLLLDPMAVMLVVAASVYFILGETRDATVLALIPVLGVDVVLEARSHAVFRLSPRPPTRRAARTRAPGVGPSGPGTAQDAPHVRPRCPSTGARRRLAHASP
jgi:hypothetical protein